MRLTKSRKASAVYPTLIAIAGLVALALCWYILLDKTSAFDAKVGEKQFELIQQFQDGEEYLLFMDQAAGYSASWAVLELANGGGYASGSSCGTIGGYEVWNSAGRDCYPTQEQLKVSFWEAFNIAMNSYSHITYLDARNITFYSFDYIDGNDNKLEFIAKPERYTDFVTKVLHKDEEVPLNAVSSSLGKGLVKVRYAELGEVIDYSELSRGEDR